MQTDRQIREALQLDANTVRHTARVTDRQTDDRKTVRRKDLYINISFICKNVYLIIFNNITYIYVCTFKNKVSFTRENLFKRHGDT